MPVVDASVVVALFAPHEERHDDAWRWLRRCREEHRDLIAPSLLPAEVAAALARGAGDRKLARRVVDLLAGERLLSLAPVTLDLGRRAAEIALTRKIRGADAVYVALAAHLARPLITLDRQQLERGAELAEIHEPE